MADFRMARACGAATPRPPKTQRKFALPYEASIGTVGFERLVQGDVQRLKERASRERLLAVHARDLLDPADPPIAILLE